MKLLNKSQIKNHKYYMCIHTGILLAFLNSQMVSGDSLVFQPSIPEANWANNSSKYECELIQEIPQFGEAVFYQRAGEYMEFQMKDFSSQLAKDIVMFRAKPATWNDKAHDMNIGVIDISKKIDSDVAMEIITNLLNRMNPIFEGSAKYRSSQSMVVALSPVKFKPAYMLYQTCINQLLPVNYDQIKETIHYWEMEGVELNDSFKKLLGNVAIYTKTDERIIEIQIDSYTDTAGTKKFNQDISDQRVMLVRDYLVEKGVSNTIITAIGHGEEKEFLAVYPEESEEDKNKNRRLTMRLVRDNS